MFDCFTQYFDVVHEICEKYNMALLMINLPGQAFTIYKID